MQRSLKWFAVLTTIGMLFVLIGGALVTKTGSGMGCGRSWPLCHGEFIPSNINTELLIELSHRIVSGVVGLMVLILSIWSWRTIGHIRETKFLAIVSFVFLFLQGLIGAAAVVWGQSDFVLALHFGISLISFAAVFLLTLFIFEVDQKFDAQSVALERKMKWHIYGIIIYCYIVVYTGALVRHKQASLACPSWPFCSNTRFFPTQLHEWVQMGHRFAAGLLFIWILFATIHAIKHYKQQRVIYWGWIIALILVSCQIFTGALVVFTKLNLYIALAHAFFISCLFGVLSYFVLLATRSKKEQTATQSTKTSPVPSTILK
ncbi:cytochrome c oxidase assembly protein subunit 15 [Thermolongibacillus altinsuensis]|uniref:Heme A synthase n=1 Tax=Thermolongibacillus altinsuensis TaxID=575256 RepID=A0A4R1QMP1_9BACL|nr:heme A synthase [Thermolongibacillus altinsuensis]TCL50239.1 cytochrome c oxidase assembly protein subunit 15 [Thermolongibacillus altinsuensis]GMB08593.1 heme A synthase [Thermolongibacillus altinsuensis]